MEDHWKVLDAINYIKDEIDPSHLAPLVVPDGGVRQLRDDGERRAEAHLQDRARPVRRSHRDRAARELPDRARSGGRARRLHAQVPKREALDPPRQGEGRGQGRPQLAGHLQPEPGTARRVQAVQHVHQLPALLRGLPGGRQRARVHRARPRSRSVTATTSIRATRGIGSATRSSAARARSSRAATPTSAARSAPRTSTRRPRSTRPSSAR